jgi:hypothetical protein
MSSDDKILAQLPPAPLPVPDVRDAAIAAALQVFDQKMHARVQEFGHAPRPTAQTASSGPSSRRSLVMMRAR